MSSVGRLIARTVASLSVGALALSTSVTGAHALTGGTTIGSLTFSPASGYDVSSMTATTSGTCPASATNVQVEIVGSGFPASLAQLVVNNSPISSYPASTTTPGYDVALLDTLRDFADQQPTPVVLTGEYTLTLMCRTNSGLADLGDFTGTINFTDPTHYVSATAIATGTTLSASSTSVTVGQQVTLNAGITPAGTAGSVQFFDGAIAIGTTKVNGSTATFTTSALAAGTHSFTAVFTPTSTSGAAPSTSAAVAVSVTPLAAAPPAPPTISQASAFTLGVGTAVTCPGGTTVSVPASTLNALFTCAGGGAGVMVHEGVAPHALVAPSLHGTGKVGTKLTLLPGLWTPAYATRTVVWKRDGKVIAGGAGGSYTVKKTDKGHHFSAVVTAHLPGHPDGSAATAAVAAHAAAISSSELRSSLNVRPARREGVAADATAIGVPVGSSIGCTAATFSGASSTTSGWLLDGQPYVGATTLVIPDSMVGHVLTCRSTATNAGGSTTSDAVATVTPGARLLNFAAPHVAGVAKVGKKLSVSTGRWFPQYASATVVWLRNGKVIKGASKATYVLAKADHKAKISVRVTVTRTGWGTATATSAAVSVG